MAGRQQWGWLWVGLALITGGAGVAQAQPNPFLDNVLQQLLDAGWAAQQEGYRLSHAPLSVGVRIDCRYAAGGGKSYHCGSM